MTLDTDQIKDQHKADYINLQKTWKAKSSEMLFVGRLSYWTYWISKLAEKTPDHEERIRLFKLKSQAMILLYHHSNYTRLKALVPDVHRRLCYTHYNKMKRSKMNPHHYLHKHRDRLLACDGCKRGVNHFFSLYSLAVLDDINGAGNRKLLYVFYAPYRKIKDQWPHVEDLEAVRFYPGQEYGTVRMSGKDRIPPLDTVFSKRSIEHKFNDNFNKMELFLER